MEFHLQCTIMLVTSLHYAQEPKPVYKKLLWGEQLQSRHSQQRILV